MQSMMLDASFLLLVSCILHFYYLSKGQEVTYCDNSINYTSGSAYQQNLNLTLTSLAANASLTGYYISTVGQNPNLVYGLINCPGFISNEVCKTCANSVTTKIIQLCPNQMSASVCNENCSLQYSDSQFFSTADSAIRLSVFSSQNADDPFLFRSQLGSLLGNISNNAAAATSRLAVGRTSYTSSIYINGMAQCTRNLTGSECLLCLQIIISYITSLSSDSVGFRVYTLSCNIRYEIYSFFSLSSLPPPPPPPPSTPTPPPSTPTPPPSVQPNSTATATNDSTSNDGKSPNTVGTVVISVAVTLAVITAILCGFLFWKKRKTKRVGDIVHHSRHDDSQPCSPGADEEGYTTIDSLSIGLNTLREATGNFCDEYKLGQGGFGPVYKGKLRNGTEIAVKRLSNSSRQGLEELKTEVLLVAKLLHRNLVWLLGFCLEEEEKLLVYEYLPNGSLDKVLFDQNKRCSLEWERRHEIIIGIARGLLYLHEDSQLRIIHRDLKASNILLDESMQPKISDFGLARLFSGSQTQGNTNRIAGTYGYMAPEYAKKGHFSTKSDVYSFGILVLEIVTGQKISSFRHTINLQSCAWQHWTNGTALELVDPTLGGQWPENEILNCIHIGLLCVQEAFADRPTMSQIVMMLNGYTMTSPAPSRPGFYVSKANSGSASGTDDSGSSPLPVSLQQSVNCVSITDLYPR
uniref:Protein kinase domain-containing protein n=1 Tax=Populus trichocarpa TaxID=3694 RepID=A0A2K1ZT59_POPTR|eukprot:XP_024460983.1 cysteine-rich receptor-like protein kinase 10 isoform X1 [Populus trichocarpa]